jgi:phasin family protein
MSTLQEQFSAARKSQIEAQLNLFSKFSARAVASAEQLIALNFNTAKAAVDHSSAMLKQMISAQDPRDLLALAGESQQQFDSALAYGRALAGIASGMQADLGEVALPVTVRKAPALPPADKVQVIDELAPPADKAEVIDELAPPPEPALVVELAPEEAEPPKKAPKPKPVAKAAAKAAGKAKPAKPAAAPFPKVEEAAGQLDMLAPKAGKKK